MTNEPGRWPHAPLPPPADGFSTEAVIALANDLNRRAMFLRTTGWSVTFSVNGARDRVFVALERYTSVDDDLPEGDD